ncbi:MAG TPA: Rrf2 family transcriptional regulator [Myxococcaceae bacterium]|jgi:Rrf2 family protein|nr:Rrf2 family transcriptional regulator [Myxococcaceae bacterium]
MLRINRLSDYALVLLSHMAAAPTPRPARAWVEESGLPDPTVRKLLKELAHAGLVVARRGPLGGYALARPAAAVSVADVLAAIEGPLSPTVCTTTGEACTLQDRCPTTGAWHRLAGSLRGVLERTTLADLINPPAASTPAAAPIARIEVSP